MYRSSEITLPGLTSAIVLFFPHQNLFGCCNQIKAHKLWCIFNLQSGATAVPFKQHQFAVGHIIVWLIGVKPDTLHLTCIPFKFLVPDLETLTALLKKTISYCTIFPILMEPRSGNIRSPTMLLHCVMFYFGQFWTVCHMLLLCAIVKITGQSYWRGAHFFDLKVRTGGHEDQNSCALVLLHPDGICLYLFCRLASLLLPTLHLVDLCSS